MWPEVETAKDENRRELKLTGASVAKRITDNAGCLDEAIYGLASLNLLDVNDTPLQVISPRLASLTHLQSLLLFRNKIAELPAAIGTLGELKVLDLSGNKLTSLPTEFGQLRSLTTLNLSFNQLKTVELTQLAHLSVCNLSGNQLEEVPEFYVGEVHHLTEVILEKNLITELPEALTRHQILKTLNVADNRIEQVPKYVSKCVKLKEINLKGNPLKDKRLLKLVDQCRSKQVLDYVEKSGYQAPKGGSTKAPKKGSPSEASEEANAPAATTPVEEPPQQEAVDEAQLKIVIRKVTPNTPKVSFSAEARTIRPHALFCIVRNFPVADLKKFLQLQNSLHDVECARREVATIATHDLAKVKGTGLRYHAAPPEEISLTTLGSATQTKVTAAKYYADLRQHAEQVRKDKKRNTYSGVHKYIALLENQPLFVYLSDEEKVISLPPLTNCDETKITDTTRDLLLEVTSDVDHKHCVRVMNALLHRMLLMDVEPIAPTTNGESAAVVAGKSKKSKASAASKVEAIRYNRSVTLEVEQVQLYDVAAGRLHSVYPGKGDIVGDEAKGIVVETAS
ncbi:leucine-rich repeat-containing protein 47-like [Anopheles darlingi]|uniref:leucine-rich repeat-containing protein 47-like n=1 Tax=Anopheles darlingi TaxID=43151 RepID=UPI00210028FC|nr:leucine-rich repeat-containing protein 47-like [Anopheles darlingi]